MSEKKTHDIVALLGLCADIEDAFVALLPEGAILNEYIVAGRYPGDLAYEAIGRKEAEEAREIVYRIKSLVEERINQED